MMTTHLSSSSKFPFRLRLINNSYKPIGNYLNFGIKTVFGSLAPFTCTQIEQTTFREVFDKTANLSNITAI